MKLGMVLHFVSLNRNSYNTLEHRTRLPFMKQSLLNETGRDRYTFTHVAALGCMLEFMSAGLSAGRAATAATEFLPFIDDFVGNLARHEANPDEAWLIVVNMADGTFGSASGKQTAGSFGPGLIASKVSVNLQAVWASFADRMDQPMEAETDLAEASSLAEMEAR